MLTRTTFSTLALAVVAVFGIAACTTSGDTRPDNAALSAQEIIELSLGAHGGLDAINTSGVVIELEGTFDLTARLQGRSAERPEPTPILERIAAHPANNRLNYEIDWYNYFSSNQKLREIYDSEGQVLFLDRRTKRGGYLPRAAVADAQKRFQRVLPNLLLADALNRSNTLQSLNDWLDTDGVFNLVSYETEAGDRITLWIDRKSKLLARAAAMIDMPLLGDAEMQWRWNDYRSIEGMNIPGRYRVYLAGELMKDTAMTVNLGAEESEFTAPQDYSVGPPPDDLTPLSEFIPYGERDPVVETEHPGVHIVRNLRPGFHMMFVEFSDFVLAVDAPTGWYEMQQIPPMNWSYGDETSALGEKYLQAIKETVPGKPIKYLVLTHHHSDHIGGMEPFLARDVEVLAGENAAAMIRKTGADLAPNITVIDVEHVVQDETMMVRLIELPDGNPKADHYLMVYLPKQKFLYTTAFIYPVPEAVFPPPESIDLSIYFVEWLDRSGLDVERIYNLHGTGLVEDWQLERIREIAAERTRVKQ